MASTKNSQNFFFPVRTFCELVRLISIMQDATSSTGGGDQLPEEPAALRALLQETQALLAAQRNAIAALEQERDRWRQECEAFRLWFERMQRSRFGHRSEQHDPLQQLLKFPDDPEAAVAMADALDEAAAAAQEVLEEREPAKQRPRPKRSETHGEFPAHLPRIVETIEPEAEEQVCSEHGAKKLIGFDETQTMEVVPPKLQVRVRRYPKYVCDKHAECGVKQAPRVPALVAGHRYDISIAIQIILSKYAYHLPLYRQQDLFAACGWTPSRSTLNNLLAAIDELFLPLVDLIRDETLADGLVGCDDTTVTLIMPPFAPEADASQPRTVRTREVIAEAIEAGRPSITARMWAYQSVVKPLNYFDFSVSRHRDGPADVLGSFQGILLGDCYAGFEAISLASDSRIARAACWAHARRKFVELETKHPLEAARMRALTGMLYDVEDRAKALTPDERKALRESESRPVVEKIREFLWGEAYEQSLPKNDLRKAMNYVRNNWDALQSFLTDGRLPLDNNNVEQLMKQIAVGRKNWLFIGSVSAGQRAARLMTIVSSALRNNLDVERYLTDVLSQLLNGCTDYHSLLPHVWRESHSDAVRTYREDERRDAAKRQAERRENRRKFRPQTDQMTDEQKTSLVRRAREKLLAERRARKGPPKPPKKS